MPNLIWCEPQSKQQSLLVLERNSSRMQVRVYKNPLFKYAKKLLPPFKDTPRVQVFLVQTLSWETLPSASPHPSLKRARRRLCFWVSSLYQLLLLVVAFGFRTSHRCSETKRVPRLTKPSRALHPASKNKQEEQTVNFLREEEALTSGVFPR